MCHSCCCFFFCFFFFFGGGGGCTWGSSVVALVLVSGANPVKYVVFVALGPVV